MFKRMSDMENFDGGFKIEYVKDGNGNALPYVINRTMMRATVVVTIATVVMAIKAVML